MLSEPAKFLARLHLKVYWWPACFFRSPTAQAGDSLPVILAFGDSLTAGFGVPENQSYPAQLQVTLKQNGYPHQVVNGGVSGDTTAGGVRRIGWLMKHNPKIVILGLGANDGLRGQSLEEMESNLERIIAVCRGSAARVLLAGMKIPPNYGDEYSVGFEKVYERLAEKHELPLISFFAGRHRRKTRVHATGRASSSGVGLRYCD